MTRALVLAYGNPLRGDDGVAWAVAEALRPIVSDSVQIQCVHQLSPELADAIRENDLVIFIDAAEGRAAGEVFCAPITPQTEPTRFWHHIGPREVIALARQLYAAAPQGFLLTIQAAHFDYGYTLSDSAKSAIPQALSEIRALLEGNRITCAEIASSF